MGKSAKKKKAKEAEEARAAGEIDDAGGARSSRSEVTSESGGKSGEAGLTSNTSEKPASTPSAIESSAAAKAANESGNPTAGSPEVTPKADEALDGELTKSIAEALKGGDGRAKESSRTPQEAEKDRDATILSMREAFYAPSEQPASDMQLEARMEKERAGYQRIRKMRLEAAIIATESVPTGAEVNLPPGNGGWIEDVGYPCPIIDNHEGPAEIKQTYRGFKGKRDAMPYRAGSRTPRRTEKLESAGSHYGVNEHQMSKVESVDMAEKANESILDEAQYWTFPSMVDVAGDGSVQPLFQCKVGGLITEKRGYADSVRKPAYVEICRGDCKQPYVVKYHNFDTVESAMHYRPPGTVTQTPSGLWVVHEENCPTEYLEPVEDDMMTYILQQRRELIPVEAKPMEESTLLGPEGEEVEVIDYPRNLGLTFHSVKLAQVETPTGLKEIVFPPFNRDASRNGMFRWTTDVLQDGHFLWSVEATHTTCHSPPRAMWAGRDLWAGGVIDIDDHKRVHALPGFVVLTDKQIKAKRPFGCLTLSNAKWIDMAERLLRRQHWLRGGDKRQKRPHAPGEAGPLSIYNLDEDIRPVEPERYLAETMRWVDTALPKCHLINLQNSAVYMVTCAAKGRELCRARAELRKHNESLVDCYEEMFGPAEAALDARFRTAVECFRLARETCIQALMYLPRMADNQSRLYMPSTLMSRALVQLAVIDTLTMGRAEMQLYTGSDKRLQENADGRHVSDLCVNPSAVIGLPMPANDLAYLWLKLMSVLQASLLHLDVVMMAGMHDPSSKGPIEWLPNQAAYLMGQARDELERASVEDVLPRIKALLRHEDLDDYWKIPLLQELPEDTYAERAMRIEHPPCIAWRYSMPEQWEENAVFPRLAGLSHVPIGEQRKLVEGSRLHSEARSRQEDYVDMNAAVNVESIRRKEWSPNRREYWFRRVPSEADKARSNIFLGEAWTSRRKQLCQVFTEERLREVHWYAADEPACAVTEALQVDVTRPIDDVTSWLWLPAENPEELPAEPREQTTKEVEQQKAEAPVDEAPTSETVSASETEGKTPIKEASFARYKDDPLPPSTASESSTGTVRKKAPKESDHAVNPPSGGNAKDDAPKERQGDHAVNPPSGGNAKDDTPKERQGDRESRPRGTGDSAEDRPKGGDNGKEDNAVEGDGVETDPDFFTMTLNLSAKEEDVQPTIEEWRELPAEVHWNVLQPRPKPRLMNIAHNVAEKELSETAMIELERFRLMNLGGDGHPIRSKTKVQSVVEQALRETPDDWQDKAAVQLCAHGRFEYMLTSHDYHAIAQSICYRETRTGYGDALEVALAKPTILPGAYWTDQPKSKQRDLLEQHNVDMETWRGVVAIMDTLLVQGCVDLGASKLPLDRTMVYDYHMLITQREWETLDRELRAVKIATAELRILEQHCYVPIEGRSFYTCADRKLREVATHLLKFAEIVQNGRSRALRQVETAQMVTTREELDEFFAVCDKKNEGVPPGDPRGIVMPQFASKEKWSVMGTRAETVAVNFHSRSLVWAFIPSPMVKSTDMVDPEGFMKEESAAILASCMMLLGVRVYSKDVTQGELHWFCPGFFCQALGEKDPSGRPREAECLQIFRTRPLRLVILTDYELEVQTGMHCSEAWLADKCYRRITNRPDDEYRNRNEFNVYGPEAYLLNMPNSAWRKMSGKPPGTPWIEGEIEAMPGVKCGYRCKGCHTRVSPTARCREFCLYRIENHQFGAIMLKHWSIPGSKMPLPELHSKERQARAIQERRLKSALESYQDPHNGLTLKEIASVHQIPCDILSRALQSREEPAETGREKWEQEVDRLEAWNVATQPAVAFEPCSACGSHTHTMRDCTANSQARAFHASRVLTQLTKPIPKSLPQEGPMGENWREETLKKMKSGTMQVPPTSQPGPSADQMNIATRQSTYASVLTKGGQQAGPSHTADGQSASYGGGGAKFAHRESGNGSDWAASLNQQSFNEAKRAKDAQLAASGFNKSYAGRPASGGGTTYRPYATRQVNAPASEHQVGDKYCPDIDAGVTACYAPEHMKVPAGWDYVITEKGQDPRLRARWVAVKPKRRGGFHQYPEIDEALSRAVYANKGFMPAVLRKCAQDGRIVPAESVNADRRVPCKSAVLGVYGKDQVWTIWTTDQKKRHDEFYNSAAYAELSKQWCLRCLCPGHLAPACRGFQSGKQQTMCSFCGDGTHLKEACPLLINGVGCDQCGSEQHGRLMCGYNELLYGDALCSARVYILATYARYLPQFYANSEEHKAAMAASGVLTTKVGKKHMREMMRVLGILGVDTGYY